jgi:hypothetical protein
MMSDAWLGKLVQVVEASRQLLMRERLMHGAWGKTMKTYLRLTQPPGSWKPEQEDLYRRLGSVTHTHHALTALRTYHELVGIPFPATVATSIVDYMITWQIGTGDVPSPVTNVAEGIPSADPLDPDWSANRVFWANMLRHTSTALTSMIRLIKLLDIEPSHLDAHGECAQREMWQAIEERWIEEAEVVGQCQGSLRRMAKLATKSLARSARTMADRILLDDGTWPKVVYSPAYVVAAVHEGNAMFGRHLDMRDSEDLEAFENFLLSYLANRGLSGHETYLCQSRHPGSCYYYTLVILDQYLGVINERLRRNPRERQEARRILGMAELLLFQLTAILKRYNGLPIGLSTERIKLPVDVGTTARFALVVEKLRLCLEEDGGVPDDLQAAATLALNSAVDLVETGTGNADLMTHSFEALIRLVECLKPNDRIEVVSRLLDMQSGSPQFRTADLNEVTAIVTRVIEEAGIEDDPLPTDLIDRLLRNEQFRHVVGRDVTVESLLARFSNPVVFHDLLDRAFTDERLRDFCSENGITLPTNHNKQQIIRIVMKQFEMGAPPPDENERQMARELLRIERLLRQFIEMIVQDPDALAAKVKELAQHRRGTIAKNILYPDEGEDPIWRDAEFGDLWGLISWRWNVAGTYFASEFYGQNDGERRKVVRHYLDQLRRIRNRVFHLHGNVSAGRDIVDDRKLLETLIAQLSNTFEKAINQIP